jgi:hypothetical protein
MPDDLGRAGLPEPGHPALAEWLEGASCDPRVKALAVRAADAADRGVSAAQWRRDLLSEHPDVPVLVAEHCSFMVAGAGYAGVETAAARQLFTRRLLPRFISLRPEHLRWVLATWPRTPWPHLR